MKIAQVLIILFLINSVVAICSDGQIDINSASAEELDKITWVGPATAEKIIAGRPFKSVDSLLNVSGIGEKKLADIKSQGLACVKEESVKTEKISEETNEFVVEKVETNVTEENFTTEINQSLNVESPAIKLNAKTIKTEENNEKIDKSKYASYGLVAFCILLIVLFIIKARKNKNEFEE